MRDDLIKHCSVHSGAVFKARGKKGVVEECLVPFPYVWASIDKVLICGTCLMMLDVAQLLDGEWQLLLTFFK